MNNEPAFPSDPLLDPLFARARAQRLDTGNAEYAFETRLLALLPGRTVGAARLGALAWRLLPVFGIVVLALGVCQVEMGNASQEAEQVAAVQNPEAVDLVSTLE